MTWPETSEFPVTSRMPLVHLKTRNGGAYRNQICFLNQLTAVSLSERDALADSSGLAEDASREVVEMVEVVKHREFLRALELGQKVVRHIFDVFRGFVGRILILNSHNNLTQGLVKLA